MLGRIQREHGDTDGQGVANMHGLEKLQRLAQVNRARAGKLGAQHRRNQRATQHAVGNDLVKRAALGVQHIDMRRVHVA